MSREVKILAIEQDGGIRKNEKMKVYEVPVRYHLEGGGFAVGTISRRLLRDAKEIVRKLSIDGVPENPMKAIFADKDTEYVRAGDFIGTQTTFGIGRRA